MASLDGDWLKMNGMFEDGTNMIEDEWLKMNDWRYLIEWVIEWRWKIMLLFDGVSELVVKLVDGEDGLKIESEENWLMDSKVWWSIYGWLLFELDMDMMNWWLNWWYLIPL